MLDYKKFSDEQLDELLMHISLAMDTIRMAYDPASADVLYAIEEYARLSGIVSFSFLERARREKERVEPE